VKVYSGQVSSDMVLLALVYILGSLAAIGLVLGLCLIDSGLVRRKNVLDTWVQKIVAALLAALGEAVAGYALWQYTFDKAYGVPNALSQALHDWWLFGNLLKVPAANIDPAALPEADSQQVFFVFFIAFAMAMAALLHSSVVERIRPVALYTISFLLGAVLMPVVAFLTWGPLSPLTTHGLHDYEGVLTIYVFVGTFALVLAQRLKPRLGTYDMHSSGSRPVPHNLSMVGAGMLLLLIAIPLILLGSGFIVPGQGYFGIDMSASGIGLVFSSYALAVVGGGVVGSTVAYLRREVQWVFYGPIAGIITCGSILDVAKPWWCLLLGACGPVVSLGTYKLMTKLKIDETKVVPLALGPGVFGFVAGGFLAWGIPSGGYPGLTGADAAGHSTITPQWQLAGLGIVIAIAVVSSILLSAIFQVFGKLRVDEDRELKGGDLAAWDVSNYNDEPLIHAVAACDKRAQSYIGKRVTRIQDERVLRGDGRFVDDLGDSGVVHAAIVRSQVASGEITRFDPSAARAAEGVLLVLGPDDFRQLEPVQNTWKLGQQKVTAMRVGEKTLRYVGQPIGIVVARSRAAAEDAAELIEIDVAGREAVVGIAAAQAADAPLVYPEQGTNQVGGVHYGDPVEDIEKIFAKAAHVVDREFTVPRISHSPMEPRGLVAEWLPRTEELSVTSSTQVPHIVRQDLAKVLRLRADQVRVAAGDVGGSFGQKASLFTDEVMVALAATRLGRKVKWIEDRQEALTASYHGRGTTSRARLALDEAGKFLAIHADLHGDVGAFTGSGTGGSGPFQVAGLMIEGPYRFDKAGSTVTAWFTNVTPTAAFRGYGMQEGTWIRERLVDEAARKLGIDPVELREKNMLKPGDLPFVTRTQIPYDNGDYPQVLAKAVAIGKDRERAPVGRTRRGIGLASMVEITGFAPSFLLEMFDIHWSGWESSTIRINEDGSVTVFSGVTGVGQGIETALAQIAAERLGVPLGWVRVQLGDTTTAPFSNIAAQASRGVVLGGGALWQAASKLRDRMDVLAGAALKADPGKLWFRDGAFHAPDGSSVTWQEVAHRGWLGWGRKDYGQVQLQETVDYDPPTITFGYATHGAQVALDLDTAQIVVEDYWVVHDSGVVVNPLIADGQLYGGVTMGLGAALYEEATFAPDGRPTATTYREYTVPLSADVPDIVLDHVETPSRITPGGFKGLGESGIIPPPAAIANALAAAVPEIAEYLVDIPLTPVKIWDMLDKAGLTR
jgi:carbon-monoxide dehydrogenase large subunit